MSGRHAGSPCGPRHARRTPRQVPAALVVAGDLAAALSARTHHALDTLEYRLDVEARRWEARHPAAVESTEDVEPEVAEVEPVEVGA